MAPVTQMERNLAIDEGTANFLAEWKVMQSDLFFGGGDVPGWLVAAVFAMMILLVVADALK